MILVELMPAIKECKVLDYQYMTIELDNQRKQYIHINDHILYNNKLYLVSNILHTDSDQFIFVKLQSISKRYDSGLILDFINNYLNYEMED